MVVIYGRCGQGRFVGRGYHYLLLRRDEMADELNEDVVAEEEPVVDAPVEEGVSTEPVREDTEQERAHVDIGLEAAKELGLEGEWDDSGALVRELAKRVKDVQPYVDYAQRVLPYDQQVSELISGQGKAEEVSKEPEPEWDVNQHFQEAWKAPSYDKAWDAFVQSGMVGIDPGTGQYIASDGYQASVPLNVLQGLNEHRSWQRDGLQKLLDDPYGSTWEAFQEPLDRMIKERMESYFGQRSEQDVVANWESEHAKELYEFNGEEPVRDIYGNVKPTEYGEAFLRTCQELRDGGMSDPGKIIELASRVNRAPTAPQETATTTQDTQEPEKGFLDKALEKASHSANAGGFSENRDIEPIVQSTLDLESMFVNEARKAGLTS